MQAEHGNAMYNDHQVIKTIDHSSWYHGSQLYNAVDLMKRCLTLDLTKRFTAKEALEHPFFAVSAGLSSSLDGLLTHRAM